MDMPGALQSTYISENQFPKVFAWVGRFKEALHQAKAGQARPARINVDELIKHMEGSVFYESVGEVDAHDPTALKAGDEVTVWPVDTGFKHRDSGKLLGLTPNDIIILKRTTVGNLDIHVHLPRWGYRVVKATQGGFKM
jgi:hypothetical protein